jgi:hypothetical protein
MGMLPFTVALYALFGFSLIHALRFGVLSFFLLPVQVS